jgi:GTP-binding protein
MQKLDSEKLFSVALVGRPNVGKSSLFNVLCKKRLALVKDLPGVTRDLRRGVAKWWGKEFSVVDTGGWTNSEDVISRAIREKLQDQLGTFDFLVFVCDARQGLTADDKNFFSIVRDTGKPFLVALNKCDSENQEEEYDFYGLGVESFYKISCEHKIGISEVVEEIFQHVKDFEIDLNDEDPESHISRDFPITVVGKPNVGKSSLVNKILKKEQQLVSSVAGTTTDTLSFEGQHGDLNFLIYDTAGVRRKTKLDGGLEGLTMIKALETIDKADFILLVLDGTEKPSRQEARMIERSSEQNKPFLIVVNKWDIAKDMDEWNKETYKLDLVKEFHFLKSFEFVFVSALTGSNIDKLFDKLVYLKEKMSKRISTGELNRFFDRAIKMTPAPFYNNKQVRLYYITQTKQKTPSFLCFANHPKGVTPAYRRFLENRIREEFDFNGVPVRVFFLPKDSSKRGHKFND